MDVSALRGQNGEEWAARWTKIAVRGIVPSAQLNSAPRGVPTGPIAQSGEINGLRRKAPTRNLFKCENGSKCSLRSLEQPMRHMATYLNGPRSHEEPKCPSSPYVTL